MSRSLITQYLAETACYLNEGHLRGVVAGDEGLVIVADGGTVTLLRVS